MKDATTGIRSSLIGIIANIALAIIKGLAGVIGNSFALIADAIESTFDIFGSILVLIGLKLAVKPPDETHPYGHGKFEPLVSVVISLMMLGAAILIGVESVDNIITPEKSPAPFTLLVLILTVGVKEWLFRFVERVGIEVNSGAINADAWHHRSDALTSLAAFIGISIAILGGEGFESADAFAALIAGGIIAANAIRLLKPALYELIDTAPNPELIKQIRGIANSVPGVHGTHKCLVRKVGFDYYVDLDVLCDPNETIRFGHEVAHNVGEAIHKSMPQITKVLVHVEPKDDFGRRSRDKLGEQFSEF